MGMGGGSKAADAAAAADSTRQQNIQQTVGQINSAYGSPQRQAQYDSYGKSLNDYYTNQVNDQETANARNLKFANARSGLTGGSAAIDSNTGLQKDYSKGLLQASQAAQGGKAALQQADTNSKNQLISLAQQGNYVGAIPQQISLAQNSALQGASNYANANTLGSLFSGTAQVYGNEQAAAANRASQTKPIGGIYNANQSSQFG